MLSGKLIGMELSDLFWADTTRAGKKDRRRKKYDCTCFTKTKTLKFGNND
jgi:hypothetical protein